MNVTAPIMMACAVVPHMLRARQGRIITVTTSLGTMVRAGYLLYGASKAAAESATAVMAADLAGTGVTANVLPYALWQDRREMEPGGYACCAKGKSLSLGRS